MKLANVAEGWARHIGLVGVPESDKKEAVRRVAICVDCPYSREQWVNKFVDGVLQKDILGSGIGCVVCGCPVNQKALVMAEACPEDKW